MRWGTVFGVTVIVTMILFYEWPKMKKTPKKDKMVFLFLLLIGWTLSFFDLPNLPGPTTLLETVYEPLGKMMEQ